MKQISLRLAFLSLYAMGTLAATLLPAHAPTAIAAPSISVADDAASDQASQHTTGNPTANASTERPRRAARIDFSMPYYRFGRLPMRL